MSNLIHHIYIVQQTLSHFPLKSQPAATECLHLQHYSRKRRRSQARNSPGCRQKCLHSPTTASDGKSSLIGGMRTGDTPPNTACKPGMKEQGRVKTLFQSYLEILFLKMLKVKYKIFI